MWKKRDCLLLKRGKDSDEEHPARLHSPPFQSALPQPVLPVLLDSQVATLWRFLATLHTHKQASVCVRACVCARD